MATNFAKPKLQPQNEQASGNKSHNQSGTSREIKDPAKFAEAHKILNDDFEDDLNVSHFNRFQC